MTQYIHGNCIINVYRPELDDAERAKQERHIANALQQFGKATVRAECERKGAKAS